MICVARLPSMSRAPLPILCHSPHISCCLHKAWTKDFQTPPSNKTSLATRCRVSQLNLIFFRWIIFQRKMPKNALHDYEQLFFSTAEILQSTISNFSCVQSFWFTILTQKSIKTTYLLGTRTNRPGKLRVIGALCCGRVNWEPLHPVLQKLNAVVSPPANPKRYSRDGTASECNASAGCSKTTWRRHRRTPRDGHPGCGNSRCARERRHRCEDIQNTNKIAVLWDCVANARKTRPRWDPYPRLEGIWESHLRCCSTRRFWETLRELNWDL